MDTQCVEKKTEEFFAKVTCSLMRWLFYEKTVHQPILW
jgi:hypothetical protein